MTIALETRGLEKSFGGLKVTRDLSLQVKQGARHALIGPNGAGKTTVINLLTGVLKPDSGRIHGWLLWLPNLVIRRLTGRKTAVTVPEGEAT